MANYIDFAYDKKSDPKEVIVWEQNYDSGEIEEKRYPVSDYLYFYIDARDPEKAEKGWIAQTGGPIQKVWASSYKSLKDGSAAKSYHDLGLKTYESDIEPSHKVMLDNYGKDHQKAPDSWNLGLYDIEVDVSDGVTFMDMRERADREINAVSVWYQRSDELYEFVLVPKSLRPEWTEYGFENIEKRVDANIIYFDDEKKLLDAFFDMNKKQETMALGAWNGDFFDVGYIFKRVKKLWNEKTAGIKMGRFPRVNKSKVNVNNVDEILYRPIGLIWYDTLTAYKKNGPELESFALSAVAEEEGVSNKIDFGEGTEDKEAMKALHKKLREIEEDPNLNIDRVIQKKLEELKAYSDIYSRRPQSFEQLYHGHKMDRQRFDEITPNKQRKKLLTRSFKTFGFLIDEVKPWAKKEIVTKNYDESEYNTRLMSQIIEKIEHLSKTDEQFIELPNDTKIDLERFILYSKFKNTFDLFIDYSIQDSVILKNLENQLKKFDTLSMLAQYNVSYFQDVFSTLKQIEQGITNFAHFKNKVVIDREYDKYKQPYNKYVDKDLMRIRVDKDLRPSPGDSEKVLEMKRLVSQEKIGGAHVLLPQIGLISVDDETPELARKFRRLKDELKEIDAQLAEFD